MRLLYLGWPRSGSTWLHKMLRASTELKDLDQQKESHLFYSDPIKGLDMFEHGMMDFSTNNWSMDSWVAARLKDCTCMMIHRHPASIMRSYHMQMANDWQQWQTACRFNNLLRVGDTLERWLGLTHGNLLLYEFEDLQHDPVRFANMVLADLSLPAANIDPTPASVSVYHALEPMQEDLLQLAETQENKYQTLANSARYKRLLSH